MWLELGRVVKKSGDLLIDTIPELWKESTDSFKMALKTFLHSDAADVFDT